jgi:orotate phosphoribosyltransferase
MHWKVLSQTEKDYIEFLYRGNCIKIGTFKLKSGRDSPYFVEMQESFDSVSLPIVGKAYARRITEDFAPNSFDLILGPAEKGTALAITTCLHLNSAFGRIPIVWDRKQPKNYGTQKRPSWIVGSDAQLRGLVRQQEVVRVIVVDDVITTGATKRDMMSKVEEEFHMLSEELYAAKQAQVRWLKIFISVNRKEKDEKGRNPIEAIQNELSVPIGWVTDSYNIFGHLYGMGLIDTKTLGQYVKYCRDYGLPEDLGRLEELSALL